MYMYMYVCKYMYIYIYIYIYTSLICRARSRRVGADSLSGAVFAVSGAIRFVLVRVLSMVHETCLPSVWCYICSANCKH